MGFCSSKVNFLTPPIDQVTSIDSIYKQNKTNALHFAVHNRDIPMVKLLLSHGANPNVPDWRGLTALDMAIEHYSAEKKDEKKEEMIDLLLDNKSKVSRHSFLLAVKSGDKNLVEKLAKR